MKIKNCLCIAMVTTVAFLVGCGGNDSLSVYGGAETLRISAEGEITDLIRGELTEDYYNPDELEEMTKIEIADYNASVNGQGFCELASFNCDVNGLVTIAYRFDGPWTYSDFSGYTLFYGTVEEAYNQGVLGSRTAVRLKDDTSLSGENLLEKYAKKHILITDFTGTILVPNAVIGRTSNAIEVKEDKVTYYDCSAARSSEPICLLLKK